jgi:hypothetical protein
MCNEPRGGYLAFEAVEGPFEAFTVQWVLAVIVLTCPVGKCDECHGAICWYVVVEISSKPINSNTSIDLYKGWEIKAPKVKWES